jgi:L-ribulose-5-phosphate 3-epimerase UlaE
MNMKKTLLILSIVILSSCSKVNDLERCHYSQLLSSFISLETNNLEYCKSIYKEIENAKVNAKVNKDFLFKFDSIGIYFVFPDDVSETYFLSIDGTLSYNLNDTHYSTHIRKELFTELMDNIDKQKESLQ